MSKISKKIQKLLALVTEAEEVKAPQPRKQKKKSTKNKIDHTHFTRFLRQSSVVSGDIKVDNYIIWYIYIKEWSISRNEKALYTKPEFFRRLAKQFTRGRYNKRRYYLLNMEVPLDIKEKAKKHLEEDRAKNGDSRKKTRLKYARVIKKVPVFK